MEHQLTSSARALGIAIVLAVVVVLLTAGVAVACCTPVLGGGHLIAGPALIATGGALLARLVYVQSRAARRAGR